MNSIPSAGVQQANGSFSSGRFASNNLPVALSQVHVLFDFFFKTTALVLNLCLIS